MMRQGIYDKAEAALREALPNDSKFWNARFNLADSFLKKDWAEARNRFRNYFRATPLSCRRSDPTHSI